MPPAPMQQAIPVMFMQPSGEGPSAPSMPGPGMQPIFAPRPMGGKGGTMLVVGMNGMNGMNGRNGMNGCLNGPGGGPKEGLESGPGGPGKGGKGAVAGVPVNGFGPGMNGCHGPFPLNQEGAQQNMAFMIVPESHIEEYKNKGAVPLAQGTAEEMLPNGVNLNMSQGPLVFGKGGMKGQPGCMGGGFGWGSGKGSSYRRFSDREDRRGFSPGPRERGPFGKGKGDGKGGFGKDGKGDGKGGFSNGKGDGKGGFSNGKGDGKGGFGKDGKGDGKGFGKHNSFGMPRHPLKIGGQFQQSAQWQQPLPDGSVATVYLIADQDNLQQAARRLNFVGHGAIIVMDCHGWNLKAAAGKLCLLSIAFMDGTPQLFLIDVLQLGEQVCTLMPFFTNPNASKFTADASTHATVLAHKFGINLAGVIDAQWAYETLQKKTMVRPLEVLDWCGLAPPDFKQETLQLEGTPEVWGQRPLPQRTLTHAAQGIGLLQAAAAVVWKRLAVAFGKDVFEKVGRKSRIREDEDDGMTTGVGVFLHPRSEVMLPWAVAHSTSGPRDLAFAPETVAPLQVSSASRQRAEMAAAAGWACRHAGLFTAEQAHGGWNGRVGPNADVSGGHMLRPSTS